MIEFLCEWGFETGEKQVEIPTVEGKNDAKDSLNKGDVGVEATVEKEEENNYEIDQHGGGWKGGGGHGGGWKGGGGGRGGGGGGGAELETVEIDSASDEDVQNYRGGHGGG